MMKTSSFDPRPKSSGNGFCTAPKLSKLLRKVRDVLFGRRTMKLMEGPNSLILLQAPDTTVSTTAIIKLRILRGFSARRMYNVERRHRLAGTKQLLEKHHMIVFGSTEEMVIDG